MVKIYTLGYFDVKLGEESILNAKGNPHQLLKLFKYFLTYNSRALLPENIIEDLWPDNEFQNPRNVLRTHISRLRNMIKSWNDCCEEFYNIEFTNGYYIFKTTDSVLIDFEEFTNLITEGNLIVDSNPDKALIILKRGLDYYGGEYLPETEYEHWIIPIKSKYNRLYLKGLLNYLEILKSKNMFQEILDVCEEAIQYIPHEEVIHIFYIEALLDSGQKRYAISHYEFFTSTLYSQFGTTPTSSMKTLYKKLQSYNEDIKDNITLNIIDNELKEDFKEKGALVCEPFYFKFLYNIEKRKRQENTDNNILLGILSLESNAYVQLSKEEINLAMDTLIDVVYNNLRKGDILSKLNDKQLVSLLYGIDENSLNIVISRLKLAFEKTCVNKKINLNIKFKPF